VTEDQRHILLFTATRAESLHFADYAAIALRVLLRLDVDSGTKHRLRTVRPTWPSVSGPAMIVDERR
jgi:hypothetical protein